MKLVFIISFKNFSSKIKEKISTVDCEDFSSTSKQTFSDINNTLPNVSPVFKNIQDLEDVTQRILPVSIRNNTSYSIAKPPLSTIISRAKEATNFLQRNVMNNVNKHQYGYLLVHNDILCVKFLLLNRSAKSLKPNGGENIELKNNTTYFSLERSKTLGFKYFLL
jgi:hypothetical protein